MAGSRGLTVVMPPVAIVKREGEDVIIAAHVEGYETIVRLPAELVAQVCAAAGLFREVAVLTEAGIACAAARGAVNPALEWERYVAAVEEVRARA
jgi:hypothetical protein